MQSFAIGQRHLNKRQLSEIDSVLFAINFVDNPHPPLFSFFLFSFVVPSYHDQLSEKFLDLGTLT